MIKNDITDHNFAKRVHAQVASSAELWLWHAERLTRAANALWASDAKEVDGWMGYSLVAGLAIETTVKALWAFEGKIEVNEKGKLGGWGRNGHNLVWLTDEISFHLTGNDRRLAETLTACIQWGGRYPVSMNYADFGIYGIDLVTAENVDRLHRALREELGRRALSRQERT
jgi:hypothetical protein